MKTPDTPKTFRGAFMEHPEGGLLIVADKYRLYSDDELLEVGALICEAADITGFLYVGELVDKRNGPRRKTEH
jgi:hypothetical protein